MTKKQKPNVAVRLPDDLQDYLRAKAAEGHRTLTGEINMRLERSRALDAPASDSASDPTLPPEKAKGLQR